MKIGIVSEKRDVTDTLRQAVALRPQHQVVWAAASAADAVEQCGKQVPDLLLIDLLMAPGDGVEATRRVMASTPCPILIVTASVDANAARVFEAMGHGALDAVDMPAAAGANLPETAVPLLMKIGTISRLIGESDGERLSRRTIGLSPDDFRLVAIGASAGGPAALAAVLRGLPRDLPASIVIIQHVDGRFATGMADWLNQYSPIPVAVANEGQRLTPGLVLLAGTSDHLVLKTADRLGYTPEPDDLPYRPSVDVFFHSVGRLWRGPAVGVLLTGMGSDGALGLRALRDRGHHTIAQDQTSSAVYGMPKAAAALNAAVDILPMERIADRIVGALARRARRAPV